MCLFFLFSIHSVSGNFNFPHNVSVFSVGSLALFLINCNIRHCFLSDAINSQQSWMDGVLLRLGYIS